MCILYQTHRLPCDVRPFLSLAKSTPLGCLPLTHVDPYSPPLSCSHRFNRHNRNSCPLHGCCTLVSIPLPCDCADTAPWGGVAVGTEADEDITRCPHFREYHRYVCVDGGDETVRGEKWTEFPSLDAWVVWPLRRREADPQPNYFCEGVEWKAAVEGLIGSGRRLWGEVSRAEERRGRVEEEGEGEGRGEAVRLAGVRVREAWVEVWWKQEVLRAMHSGRAEALLGFGGVESSGGEYPGGGGNWI